VGEGTGLGLAVVHGVVTRLGGHIIVESGSGRGCCIRLRFPPAVASMPAPENQTVDSGEVAGGRGEQIIVVDDEPELADNQKLKCAVV